MIYFLSGNKKPLNKQENRRYYAHQEIQTFLKQQLEQPRFRRRYEMAEPLADIVIHKMEQAAELSHRLVILVAPAGSGKTAVLLDVHKRTAAPYINVNLELSRRMLDLT